MLFQMQCLYPNMDILQQHIPHFYYFVMFAMAWIMSKYILKQRVSPLWLFWKPTLVMFGFIAAAYFLGDLGLNTILFILIKIMLLALFSFIVFYKEIRTILHLNK